MSSAPITTVPLDNIASCFEGVVPSTICTCDCEGTPNLTFLSIVHRIDADHVGLSYQFFNKTRRNLMENPLAQLIVVSPETGYQFRLDLRYERTDTEGQAFDRMKTRLDAVASQTGMRHVFRLRGVDVYTILDCRPVDSEAHSESVPKPGCLPELEEFTERLAACTDLDSLIDTALDSFSTLLGYPHSFVMVPDEEGKRLYTLASHGYADSGAGSEVWIGEGILGIAAERRTVVRNTNMTLDALYSQAVRSALESRSEESMLERAIALPGLPDVRSQLVIPLVSQRELLGVLCLQSATSGRFLSYDERVVQIGARHLAASMATVKRRDVIVPVVESTLGEAVHSAPDCTVKHYLADDSIFLDDAYLIKGIAGRIFWNLIQEHKRTGRVDFTNREMRLDRTLQLPDIKDNLEARLILLRRRLEDHCDFVRLVAAGRGRLYLELHRKLTLEELP